MIDPFVIDKKKFEEFEWANSSGSETDRLAERLVAIGLDPYQVELLIMRLIEKKPMKDIVKALGWKSVQSANYHLKQALKTLRERKFNLND